MQELLFLDWIYHSIRIITVVGGWGTPTISACVPNLSWPHAQAVIGANLSEPHTSVTALLDVCMYVCMSACAWPHTENLNERMDLKIAKTNSCSVKARLRTITDKGRLLTDGH